MKTTPAPRTAADCWIRRNQIRVSYAVTAGTGLGLFYGLLSLI